MTERPNHGFPPANFHVVKDDASGLDAVIVVHSTTLGPAAGGCRLWSYADRKAMAADACRLAEGMSYKNALAGLPLGGGKAVIRKPARDFDRRKLFQAFGRAVEGLQGSYVTAEDVGTTTADMESVRTETKHVAGLPMRRSSHVGGDPSPWTARSVFLSMQLAAERRLGRPLSDCTVAIQGVGHVGAVLAAMLHKVGARLVVSDVDAAAAAKVAVSTGATVASVGGILSAKADIFAPCALGGIIRHDTVGLLVAKVVCGAANNQLAEAADGNRLADRGILYAPDYVVNAGGIINVAAEYLGWSQAEAAGRIEATADRLARVLDLAATDGISPHMAGDRPCPSNDRGWQARPASDRGVTVTRLLVRGAGSPELLLRLLNLLAQQGTVVSRAAIDLADGDYQVKIDMTTDRGATIAEKIRAMVLVHSVEMIQR